MEEAFSQLRFHLPNDFSFAKWTKQTNQKENQEKIPDQESVFRPFIFTVIIEVGRRRSSELIYCQNMQSM